MATRFKIELRALAEAEYARDRIAERSAERAERWFDGLFEQIDALLQFPLRCPRADLVNPSIADIRELLYGKGRDTYRIFFVIEGDVIRILSVQKATRGRIDL